MALFDTIEACKKDCTITTLNLGFVAGLGALITGAGTKGRRYALPNARFLLTTAMPGEVVQGQAEDIKNEITQKIKMNDAVKDVISKVTGRQRELVNKDFRRDFYLNAEEVRKEEEKGQRGRERVGGGQALSRTCFHLHPKINLLSHTRVSSNPPNPSNPPPLLCSGRGRPRNTG
jgi:hypothetical protein